MRPCATSGLMSRYAMRKLATQPIQVSMEHVEIRVLTPDSCLSLSINKCRSEINGLVALGE